MAFHTALPCGSALARLVRRTVTGRVDTRVPVAETLIVGRVPESYTYFEGSDSWDEPLEQFDITT